MVLQWMIDTIRGPEATLLAQRIPPALEGKHVNELLGRHPYHPYNPDLPTSHPCYQLNQQFFQCMESQPKEFELHQKHVSCYHPTKVELMKCIVRTNKEMKQTTDPNERK
eukprot:PhF_6_TR38347/c0_g1_i1/m.57165